LTSKKDSLINGHSKKKERKKAKNVALVAGTNLKSNLFFLSISMVVV
jgi:uncharacterized FAD-dependent dehydrogenase